jgi:lipoprotein-releasing system ATP-binding protein
MPSVAEPAEVSGELLFLSDIRKSYDIGTDIETEILHGIDLVMKPGEFCALIGPSGSGKSTLLNIIGLLDRPTSGVMRVNGLETADLNDAAITGLRSRAIGFVFQAHCLIPAFTALENVMMPMLVARGWPNDSMKATAGALLERVGLSRWESRMVGSMSGGQQQRVSIARALAMNPALVLADEPTGNLDTKSADDVFALMRELCTSNGTAFLIVTHNLDLAGRTDRVVEIVDGKISKAARAPATVSAG